MTERVELPGSLPADISAPDQRARWCCAQLEEGNILFLPHLPFELPADDIQFLLTQQQSGARHHKNIAYRPTEDRLTGFAGGEAEQVGAASRRDAGLFPPRHPFHLGIAGALRRKLACGFRELSPATGERAADSLERPE